MINYTSNYTFSSKGSIIELSVPIVMGIMNITPDSFYSKSRYNLSDAILKQAELMLTEGATIIDIGAYSSRPGADNIEVQEEINRLDNALSLIRKRFPEAILSVDTFRSKVARFAVNEYGVDIINDISGGTMDNMMFQTVAELNTTYILMHIQGTPQNMQNNPFYDNVSMEIVTFFSKQIRKLVELGVKDIIIDPGFGFGKTSEHNFEILSHLEHFQILQKPLLVGLSRKSMIYNTLNSTPEDSLNGTTILNTIALQKGANILRVHDVKEAVDCIKLVGKLKTN